MELERDGFGSYEFGGKALGEMYSVSKQGKRSPKVIKVITFMVLVSLALECCKFEKIQKALANTQVQAFSRTLKRTGHELEEPSSKQQKSTEAIIPSVPDVPQPPVVSSPHVLETVSGEVLYMFADVSYPLSMKLMERMLKHKLEIDKDVVGNDMTTAEQLIRFIKNQIVAAQVSPV
ncbi:hypothetical protein Tco_0339669 [Tanacetum coccineum]